MQSLFAETLEYFKSYFADSLYPLLFFLCLVLIAFYPGAKKERPSLLWPNLLFLAVTFCPLTAYAIMKMIGGLVYWRMFWLLTIPITLAYAGVRLTDCFSRKTVQALTAIAAAAAIICSGQFIFTENYFSARMNYFKIPTEAIYVSEVISAHAEKQEIESPKAAVTAYLSVYIRQYDAGIRLAYGRNMVKGDVSETKLYQEINSSEPSVKKLAKLVRKAECEYLVLPSSLEMDDALAEYDFEKVDAAGGYTVYFDIEADGE
ncbi:MAG: hypothetical protein LUF35_02235 [Lachnospiraceae bacterium]|nr:hypothetical protein [Lachnospiraceae bacterium]